MNLCPAQKCILSKCNTLLKKKYVNTFYTINGKVKIKYGCRNGQETTEISHEKDLTEVFGIDIMRAVDEEHESKINPHNQVPILSFFFPLQVAVLSFLMYILQRKQPPEVLCQRNVLEGFPEFPRENTCAGVSSLLEERLWQRFFPMSAGFAKLMGLPLFKEHPGRLLLLLRIRVLLTNSIL